MYAGLRRIGNPEDGTALWTRVPDEKVAQKLEERTKRRIEEARLRELRREEQRKEAEKQEEKKELLQEIEDTVIKLNDKKCCTIA